MNEAKQIDRILIGLALPRGQWVLAGSGVMVLHGIEREHPLSDLDIFCSTRLWFDRLYDYAGGGWRVYTTSPMDPARKCDPPYLYKVIDGLEVNLFFGWRARDYGNLNVNSTIEYAEEVAGWPSMTLGKLLAWKQAANREKDQSDIMAISALLAKKGLPVVKG